MCRVTIILLWMLGACGLLPAEGLAKLKTQTITVMEKEGVPSFEIVQIPAGKIVLKDDKGVEKSHEIKSIWIAKHETTWDAMWPFANAWDLDDLNARRAAENDFQSRPSKIWRHPHNSEGSFPANCISLQNARQYCAWLSQKTGKKFRLPTDAEWEYACRAGASGNPFDEKKFDDHVWHAGNSEKQTHEVGKTSPNAWGLHDMLGNVAEWVMVGARDGLVAGGSWADAKEKVDPLARQAYTPKWQESDSSDPKGRSWFPDCEFVGFRVVMEEAEAK